MNTTKTMPETEITETKVLYIVKRASAKHNEMPCMFAKPNMIMFFRRFTANGKIRGQHDYQLHWTIELSTKQLLTFFQIHKNVVIRQAKEFHTHRAVWQEMPELTIYDDYLE